MEKQHLHLGLTFPSGDCHDQRPAGADGADGERLQPGHPQHHLRSPAGLCPGDPEGASPTGCQEEEECSDQVSLSLNARQTPYTD